MSAIQHTPDPCPRADCQQVRSALAERDNCAHSDKRDLHTLFGGLAEGIVSTVRSPLLVLDGTLRVYCASPSFYRTFRTSPTDTVGQHLYELGNGQWDIPALRVLLSEILAVGTVVPDFEVDHVFPGIGRRIMLLDGRRIEATPYHDPMILLAIEDVTERVLAQQQLNEYAARLERTNHELEAFASAAAHDFQEPLRSILSFGERLQAQYGDVLDERGRDYLRRSVAAAHRLRGLLASLLEFARVSRNEETFAMVDLAQIADEVVSDLEELLSRSGGRVEVQRLPTVYANVAHMRQLLQNLVGNALKFRRTDVAPLVRVSAAHDHERCVLTVEDNGIGFDDKYAARIFQIFERLHGGRKFEGNGVGLAICHKIARLYGGHIDAASTPGVGSTFTVTLSLLPDRQEHPQP